MVHVKKLLAVLFCLGLVCSMGVGLVGCKDKDKAAKDKGKDKDAKDKDAKDKDAKDKDKKKPEAVNSPKGL
jgi:hypothetical protein